MQGMKVQDQVSRSSSIFDVDLDDVGFATFKKIIYANRQLNKKYTYSIDNPPQPCQHSFCLLAKADANLQREGVSSDTEILVTEETPPFLTGGRGEFTVQQAFRIINDLLYYLPFCLSAFLITSTQTLVAQQELSLPHLWHIGQQNSINPAAHYDSTYYINIPDIAVQFGYSEPSLREVLSSSGAVDIVNVDRAVQLLHPTDNEVTINFSAQSYRAMYNTSKWSIQQFQKTRFQADTKYPKALAELGWQGNAPFIGQTLDIGPSFEMFSYQETGIGGSYQLGKWRLGASLKLLSGIGVATSTRSKASLRTDEDIYQLELDTDYEVLTADFDANDSFVNFGVASLDFSDITLLNFRLPELDFDVLGSLFNFRGGGRNRGIAFDIGAVYQFNEQWRFGLSVLDLGRIKWRDNAFRYASSEKVSFNGVNLGRLDFASSEEIFSFDNLKDTLEQVIDFSKTSTEFKTSLAAQTYLHAQYQHNANWAFGLALYGRFGENDQWGGSVSANYEWKLLNVGIIYAAEPDDLAQLGMNLSLRLGPLQLYGMTNNILTVFQPQQIASQNARIGMAFIFGGGASGPVVGERVSN